MSQKTIIIDFELAAINAICSNFVSTKITGCFYHFKNNLLKNLMKKNSKYKQCEHCIEVYKLIQALPYVPPGFVTEVYNKNIVILNKTSVCDKMNTFCYYFEKTYVGKKF